ncbi:hypothetical protein GGE24_006793 [Bradyrhizobium centrosematis]|nr:hypothetical protein [Bradyrhizobium centrosematis]MCS3777437.1 hypothetical protein [Bradyrhizobium centrosematis]
METPHPSRRYRGEPPSPTREETRSAAFTSNGSYDARTCQNRSVRFAFSCVIRA